MNVSSEGSEVQEGTADVTVFWRPGCPFCVRLRWGLKRLKVSTREIDIWDDPSAAFFVRSVNAGFETVPTVVVGTLTLVNPTPRQVKNEVLRQVSGPAT